MAEEQIVEGGEGAVQQEEGNSLLTGAEQNQTPPEGDKAPKAADAGEQAAKQPEAQLPDKYELKMPEGMELDSAMLEQATPLFKELKLTGEQAQKLSDLYANKVATGRKEQLDAWNGILDGWRESAKSDPEIGGAKFGENVGTAKAALDKFGTPELKKALDDYGMGNHPEMIRLLARVGKALSEDRLVDGKSGAGSPDPAKVLYPGMN